VKTKAVIAGAVVLAVLLFIVMFLPAHHSRPQAVTVRHVKSVQSSNVTTMTFEVTNHTADTYVFKPAQILVRDGNSWTMFQDFERLNFNPLPKLAPRGVALYDVDVTNLPANSVVLFLMTPQKVLVGVDGFILRVKWDVEARRRVFPLNPFDRSSQVYGTPAYVVSEEWVETGK
jgi:hypothetical protein